MIAAFNALPRTADNTEGFFSRWVVVPFSATFPAGVADTSLIDRLTRPSELQGLLVRSITGLQDLMRRGRFHIPASVAKATQHFRNEADPIRGFMSERLEFKHPDRCDFVLRTLIYETYAAWAVTNGFMQISARRFYESMNAAFVSEGKTVRQATKHGYPGYYGVVVL